jgi:hypothetical protein
MLHVIKYNLVIDQISKNESILGASPNQKKFGWSNVINMDWDFEVSNSKCFK